MGKFRKSGLAVKVVLLAKSCEEGQRISVVRSRRIAHTIGWSALECAYPPQAAEAVKTMKWGQSCLIPVPNPLLKTHPERSQPKRSRRCTHKFRATPR
jgi:hypothetical protein